MAIWAGRCLHAIGNVGLFVSLIISNQTSRPCSRFAVMQREAHLTSNREYHALLCPPAVWSLMSKTIGPAHSEFGACLDISLLAMFHEEMFPR
jgi:hypothetical protein